MSGTFWGVWHKGYAVGLWKQAYDLVYAHKAIVMHHRKIAWWADEAYHLTLAGMYSKGALVRLSFAYSAINNAGMLMGTARWPAGGMVFFNNKAKHRGELGLHFKDEIITAHTIIRITPFQLIEDKHDCYTTTPPTAQD